MSKRVLVAYATGAGSTVGVAEAIAEVIRGVTPSTDTSLRPDASIPDVPVDVREVSTVDDLRPYSAVVLGSSIRLGRWLPEAVTFLQTHQTELTALPVALFTTCLTMVNDTDASRRTALAYMEPLLHIAPNILPVGIGLFAGALDPNMRLIMPTDMGPYGDHRDWDAIHQWAREIRPRLLVGDDGRPVHRDFSDAVLSFTDLTGNDLHNLNLRGADLEQAVLRRTNLSGADLGEANLTDADLRRANLEETHLYWSNLRESDLRGSVMVGANLMGADLEGADLSGADLTFAVLNGANLCNAVLHGTTLVDADLNWANFSGADLDGANLSGARLGWADLSDVSLATVDLTRAYYNNHTQWPDDFDPEAAGCVRLGDVA